MMPFDRMDCANSASRSLWNIRRGWSGLASMASTGTDCVVSSRAAETGIVEGGRVGSSAPRPLPSALRELSGLFMCQNLFCELDVAFSAPGSRVVDEDRLAEAGGLGQTYTAGNDGVKNLFAEELLQIVGYLTGKVGSIVVHREQDAFDFDGVVKGIANSVDSVHKA